MNQIWDLSTATEATTPSFVADFLNGGRRKFVAQRVAGLDDASYTWFRGALRALVEQWIASGKFGDGDGENPSARSAVWTSEEYSAPLIESLREFWSRHLWRAWVDPTTGIQSLRLELGGRSDRPGPEIRARDYGIMWFARLLVSESPERLSQCRWCGRFFVRQRKPKEGADIVHGPACGRCAGKTHKERTNKSRERTKGRRFQIAVDAWASWDPAQANRVGDREVWVLSAINQAFPYDRKTQNWVNRKRAEIEKEAEERQPTKG